MKRLHCVGGLIVMLVWACFLSACGASTPAPSPAAAPSLAPVAATPAASAAVATAAPAPSASSTPVPDIRAFIDQVSKGPHDTVKSADGATELLIPKGALPAGKSVGDISVKPIPAAQVGVTLDKQPPLFAYQLEPDGLQFSTPVLLRITRDAAADGSVPALFMLSGDQVSPLTPMAADTGLQTGKLTLMSAITHFSILFWRTHGAGSVFVLSPGDQLVKVPFLVRARSSLGQDVWLPGGIWKLFGFFSPDINLDPSSVIVDPPDGTVLTDRSYTVNQQFTCRATGLAKITYVAAFNYDEGIEVNLRGEVRDATVNQFFYINYGVSLQCKEPTLTPTPTKIGTPVDTTPQTMQQLRVTLDLGAGRDEGSTFGQAFLFSQGDKTKVELHLKAGTGSALPASIQQGACPNPGALKYPLNTVLTGTATTLVDASLDTLLSGGFAINVQKSPGQPNVYVACANIPKGAVVTLGPGRDGDQTPGTMVLLSAGAQTRFDLAMKPAGYDIVQPANVYEGSCANLGSVKYPLGNVNGGMGYAKINAPLADLLKGGYAISVQKSTAEPGPSVACADLK